ncbi:MAG: hypothetical protein ABI247_15360 [Rhodanobacter sp.]
MFHALNRHPRHLGLSNGIGGGEDFAPNLDGNEQAMALILKAIKAADGQSRDDGLLGFDPATSEM